MTNEKDYREKIEEHRQEVELDEFSTRRKRHVRNHKKKKKQTKSPLMTVLVFIFILIPLSILSYVWFFYTPEEVAEVDKGKTVVEFEKNNEATNSGVESDSKEEATEESDEEETSTTDSTSSNTNQDDVELTKEEQAEIERLQAEAEQKLKDAKEKAEREAKEKAEREAKEKEQAAAAAAATAKKHLVQPGDTLYSLARKYYNDPSMVDKIKAANNLTTDSIPVGKEIIIP